jgi:hypothetical protein
VNYLKIWLNHFCTSLLPVSSSLLPVYFQSTSSLLPVYFQFSARLQPTSKSTFLCQFFSFYEVLANNDGFGQYFPFWLIRLKPYCLQDRKILIDIIDYPLCTVEKKQKNIKQTETKSVNYLKIWLNNFCTSLLPVSSSLLPIYFQFVPVYFQSSSSLLPVFIQTPANFQEYIFVYFFL